MEAINFHLGESAPVSAVPLLIRVCCVCKHDFTTENPKKRQCPSCVEKAKERYKESHRQASKAYERRQVGRPQKKSEIAKKDALSILSEAGVQNQYVQETIYERLAVAAKALKLPLNEKLIRDGIQQTKFDRALSIEDGDVVGELSTRVELYRLWDASISWRESISFEDFLRLRRLCKTDVFELGLILGKDFHECHRRWAEFFPVFNPDGLPRNYTQQQAKSWLAAQSPVKDRLLMASRNAYKSSFSLVWAVAAVLNLPDIRLALISETTKLSKSFIRSFRAYWEVTSEPTRFQQLFPEYCIGAGDGSVLNFESPMRHLALPQLTAEATSMDSTVAGSRFDIGIFDDPVSNLTVTTEEQRESSAAKFDAICKLREVGGYVFTIGTPWHEQDLYATLVQRNDADPNHAIGMRFDPAWTVKPEAADKDIHDLVEADVVLLFPERLTFAFLKKELGKTKDQERFFRSQNLIEFLKSEEEETLSFDIDRLTAATIAASSIPSGETCVFVDTAWSQSARADNSSITAITLARSLDGYWIAIVRDQVAGRWRGQELAFEVLKMCRQWNAKLVLMEKPFSADLIWDAVRQTSVKYGYNIPLQWIQPLNSKDAKFKRLKQMEVLLPDRLRFQSGPYCDLLFDELQKCNCTASKLKSKRTDRGDSIALAVQFWKYLLLQERVSDEDLQKQVEQQQQAVMRAAVHDWIFSGGRPYTPPVVTPEAPVDPRRGPLVQQGRRLLGPGFRV